MAAKSNQLATAVGSAPLGAISIHFGPHAKRKAFSIYSRAVLTSIMKEAGVHAVWITSTFRDAHDQAKAMARNIETKGADSQRRLYSGKPGSPLVDLYEREKAALADAERRGIDTGIKGAFAMQQHLVLVLEHRISKIGPERVSKHSGLQAILNVFDVDSKTIEPKNQIAAFRQTAMKDPRVTRLIPPGDDPAFHFEIAQLGDFEISPLMSSTA